MTISSLKDTVSSLGLMVGVIIGAGMFALPYAVMKAGLFWGVFHLVLTFFIITIIHILYGAVVTATPGMHRLPGYARTHLGPWAERAALLSAFGGFYGALLVYGILGGVFLSRLFPFVPVFDPRGWVIIFFAVGALMLLLQLRRVGEINFLLTFLLVGGVGMLVALSLPHVQIQNVFTAPDAAAWFLPYGVFLFAFTGASAIPDAAEAFRRRSKTGNGRFRRVLVLSTMIPLCIYFIFVGSVLGVSGADTSPEAIFGLEKFLGAKAVIVGSFIGFLAVFTSFLALGLDLKNIFRYDLGLGAVYAWGAVVSVPVLLFLAGLDDFVRIIGFVGALAIGIDGIIILLSSRKVCCTGNRCVVGSFSFHPALSVLLIIALAVGVVYEMLTVTGMMPV